MKKILLYFGTGFSSLMLFGGIMIFVQNSGSESKATDIMLIVIFALLDFFCISKLIKNKKKTKELDKKIERTFQQQTQIAPNTYNNTQQNNKQTATTQDSQNLQSEKQPIHIVADDSQVFISTDNTVIKADGSAITDEEVQYLIQSDYQGIVQEEQQSTNPKFHRTPREKELEFQFIYNHRAEIKKWEESFENPYRKSADVEPFEEKLALLEQAAENFEKAKQHFFTMGRGATIYFEDIWLYMHNSRNECFSYGDMINNSIQQIKEDAVLQEKITNIIRNNTQILQKNIYSHFDIELKPEIQRLIKHMEKAGIVNRTKSGNSYMLTITND